MTTTELIAAMKSGKRIENLTHGIIWDGVRYWWSCGDPNCCLEDIDESGITEWLDGDKWEVMP